MPEEEQNRIAAQLLDELAANAKWDALLATDAPQLKQLAAEALEEYRAGRTYPLPCDRDC